MIFVVALIPPAFLTLTYDQPKVELPPPDTIESYPLTPPPPTTFLYAFCGIPLGIVTLLALGRSLITAQKRGDKVLGRRAGIMLSAIMVDEAAYLVFVFSSGIMEFVGLVASISAASFLLFAVLKTTGSVE